MNQEQPPPDISFADWDTTPEAVRQLVYSLLHSLGQLQQQVAALEEKVNKNSGNSSQPPSSDPPYKRPPPKAKKKGRKRGGQKGHAGQGRKLKAVEQVSRVVRCKPTACWPKGSEAVTRGKIGQGLKACLRPLPGSLIKRQPGSPYRAQNGHKD